jgi:pimeloyl-ACP methyl ester carboxylesterase
MGGWLSLLAARQLPPGKLAGLVLIAPAVDFTESLMWAQFTDTIKRQIMETGLWLRHSEYSPEPYPISRALIENGRGHLLFGAPFRTHCPVHILQGMRDPDVPWQHALKLVEHLPNDEVTLTLINDGDHRLSRDQDIARLITAVAGISAR